MTKNTSQLIALYSLQSSFITFTSAPHNSLKRKTEPVFWSSGWLQTRNCRPAMDAVVCHSDAPSGERNSFPWLWEVLAAAGRNWVPHWELSSMQGICLTLPGPLLWFWTILKGHPRSRTPRRISCIRIQQMGFYFLRCFENCISLHSVTHYGYLSMTLSMNTRL